MVTKQAAPVSEESLSPKEEPSTPPPTTPKKAKKPPSTPSTNKSRSSIQESPGNGMPGSLPKSARGRYMELIFEAGLKAINKKAVQDETGLSPAQQNEMVRKDKGGLRRAVGGFVSGL